MKSCRCRFGRHRFHGVYFAAGRRLVRNRGLRWLMAAWTAFNIGGFAHFVLLIVFVFSVGGASAVGVAIVVNMLPGGLVGLMAAALATSARPQLHLAIGIGARGLATFATVFAVLSGASVGVVLGLTA